MISALKCCQKCTFFNIVSKNIVPYTREKTVNFTLVLKIRNWKVAALQKPQFSVWVYIKLSFEFYFNFNSYFKLAWTGIFNFHFMIHFKFSMKRARLMTVSKSRPLNCPFNSYDDLRSHWKNMVCKLSM